MKVVAGSSNLVLATELANQLKTELVPTSISEFDNGEKRIKVEGKLRGESVVLVQSLAKPVNDHIVELLLLVDALERLGVASINAVIPWLAYSLQDKVFLPGEPISAKVVADLISNSFIHQIFLLDLHNSSIPGFFSKPTFHLSFLENFARHAEEHIPLDRSIVVSPDFGGLKKARHFADRLKLPLANIDKSRDLTTGEVTINSLHGESVKGKCALLFDDCIVSGSTAVVAAEFLKQQGADQIHFFATHGLFAGPNSLTRLIESPIDSIIISDSITRPSSPDKLTVLPSSDLFAQAISTQS